MARRPYPGRAAIAPAELESRVDEIPKERRLIVLADEVAAGAEVAGALGERGLDAVVREGGMKAWKNAGFTLQPSEDPDVPEEG